MRTISAGFISLGVLEHWLTTAEEIKQGAGEIGQWEGHLPCTWFTQVSSLSSHMVLQALTGVIPDLRARSNPRCGPKAQTKNV